MGAMNVGGHAEAAETMAVIVIVYNGAASNFNCSPNRCLDDIM